MNSKDCHTDFFGCAACFVVGILIGSFFYYYCYGNFTKISIFLLKQGLKSHFKRQKDRLVSVSLWNGLVSVSLWKSFLDCKSWLQK